MNHPAAPRDRRSPLETKREAAAYLMAEAKRLAAIADRFGFQDAGDSCHQLRLRAETALREEFHGGGRA